jgi:hypothetical protein
MEKVYNLLDVDRDQLWNVRIVEKGDSYGRDMCLTYDETDPLVEFYDADASFNDGPKDIGMKLGQFVSRYYMSTLMGNEFSDPIGNGQGLCLDGGVPKWEIEGAAMKKVARFLDRYQKEVA